MVGKMWQRAALIIGMAALAAPAALAQNAPARLRGTIERMDGKAFIIKTRNGKEEKVVPGDKLTATAVVKASLADVKQGSYIGVAGMPQADGSQKAIEIHIFPESRRGAGEGFRPWDLKPNSTMTNANVDQQVKSVDGQTLTLKYKGGEKKILVAPDTEVVAYESGNAADLKPGTHVIVTGGKRQPDGSISADRFSYGKDGLTPPM
jgi:hypothetical protein